MKKDVLVSFTSYNAYEHADIDKVIFETKGSFYQKEGKFYLKYEEQLNDVKVSNTLQENIKASVEKGDVLGYAKVMLGDVELGRVELVATADIDTNVQFTSQKIHIFSSLFLNNF